jgi:hypothetical protein
MSALNLPFLVIYLNTETQSCSRLQVNGDKWG